MRLYFKMRDINDITPDEQKEFIRKYIEEYCNFGRCGVEIDKFMEHTLDGPGLKSKNFVVGTCKVSEDADFERIELKMKLFNVHHYFVIIAVL